MSEISHIGIFLSFTNKLVLKENVRLSYSGLVCLPSKEDIVSSNLISRSTINAFTKSFLLQLILDTRIGYLGSFFVILEIFAGHVLQ